MALILGVACTSHICASDMLLAERYQEVQDLSDLQWHNVHTKFSEHLSIGSNITRVIYKRGDLVNILYFLKVNGPSSRYMQ
jgi:hypothetical protein